jgi:DNA repair protein SbcD/Mre11
MLGAPDGPDGPRPRASTDTTRAAPSLMFKFLHAADIHLDSPLRGLDRYEGCPSDQIRGATRLALDNLVDLAIKEKVAFVLIAGDVYDGDWKDHNTGLWFVGRMARLRQAGIKVFLIQGNHDAQNRMTRSLRLPDGVTTLQVDRPQTCHLADFPVAIHGQGFAKQAVTDDLAANYPAADPGCFNVGMLHTSVNGREGHDRYAPCTVEALRAKNYGYWALGHVHNREILHDSDGPIVFPGNVQGRHIREGGPKGCVVVTVEGHQVASHEFRPLDVLRWETCRIDASNVTNPDDVAPLFQDALPALLEAADDRFLALRVVVDGETSGHEAIVADADQIARDVQATAIDRGSGRVWVEKVKVRTRAPRIGRDRSADGPLRELDRLLDELRGDDRELLEFAKRELGDLGKKLPRDSGAAEAIDLDEPEWLRGVLDEVRPLLAERFRTLGRDQ